MILNMMTDLIIYPSYLMVCYIIQFTACSLSKNMNICILKTNQELTNSLKTSQDQIKYTNLHKGIVFVNKTTLEMAWYIVKEERILKNIQFLQSPSVKKACMAIANSNSN